MIYILLSVFVKLKFVAYFKMNLHFANYLLLANESENAVV